MIKDALGDRMKSYYEEVSKTKLIRRMPVIIRLDGCHFHTFTRGFAKPFDDIMVKTMQDTMKYLCENIQGCVLGYTQSDEITLVLVDYATLETDAWFGYEVQKICSVSAALATMAFNKFFYYNVADLAEDEEDFKKYARKFNTPYFDARCFNIPKEEVTNCVLWRQLDAERNSINSLAQSLYSPSQLQGIGRSELVTKMEKEKGVIWGNLPTVLKRGSCCIKDIKFTLPDGQVVKERDEIVYDGHKGIFYFDGDGYYFFYTVANTDDLTSILKTKGIKLDVKKESKWIIDTEIPQFKGADREYIERLVGL